MFGYVICLKLKIFDIYTKVKNRMIKTGLIKVNNIENGETIMIITKILVTTVIMKIIIIIRIIMRIKIGNRLKI